MKTLLSIGAILYLGAAMPGYAADAKEVWMNHCAQCHGADGKGQTAMGKKLHIRDFTDAKVQLTLKDDDILRMIREGRKAADGKTLMKPAENVTDDDINGLVQVVRGFKQ